MRRLPRTPAGARPRPGSSLSGVVAAALAGLLLLAACAWPGSGDATAGGELPADLGTRAGPLRDSDLGDLRGGAPALDWWDEGEDELVEDEDEDDGASSAGRRSGSSAGGSSSGGSSGAATSSAAPTGPATLARISDPRGDHGRGPGYADLRRVTLADAGRHAVVTVDVDASIPKSLADGEVMGVGVDIFDGGGQDSDYQLFADGGSDGWRAYLHTPQGFVSYPGTFRVGKGRLVFEVPWRALGRPRSGSVSSFADWSRRATPLNEFSEDAAPDRGRASFTR